MSFPVERRRGDRPNLSYTGSLGAGASTDFGLPAIWSGTNGSPTLTCTEA